jgi:hypothetical protein
MSRSKRHVFALLTLNAGLLCAGETRAGSWLNSAPFGATLKGDLYTPTTPASPPAILVVLHMCTGHSSVVHGWFDSYADQNGFFLIAPDAGKNCFDASASRSGDPAAVVTMVNWVVTNKNADKTRVFAAGMSSGGCMTNTLLAIYPDVFAGGSAMPGFPAGAWPPGDTTCTKCGSQPPSTSGSYWGDIARSVFPWSGTYPCSQQWVGGGDEYNFTGWLPAVAAQFQNLGNLGAGTAGTGAPNGWTRTVYKDGSGNVRLETNVGPTSQKHDLETVSPPLYGNVVSFLGLDKPTGACGIVTSGSGGMSGTGGTSGTGGASGTGGTSGTSATGGTGGTGGTSATGGTGGTSATGGTGGTSATGGTGGTAGRSGTGGTSTTGGTSGTTAKGGTGGTNATGGTDTTGGTGGTNAMGGTNANGGTGATQASGGSDSTGAGGSKGGTSGSSGQSGTSTGGVDGINTVGGEAGLDNSSSGGTTGGSSPGGTSSASGGKQTLPKGGTGANAAGAGNGAGANAQTEDLTIDRYHACLCNVPGSRNGEWLWSSGALAGLAAAVARRRRQRAKRSRAVIDRR